MTKTGERPSRKRASGSRATGRRLRRGVQSSTAMAVASLTFRQRVEFRVARVLGLLPPRAQVKISGRPPIEIDGQTLEPEIQMTLALIERQGQPPMESLSPAQARE